MPLEFTSSEHKVRNLRTLLALMSFYLQKCRLQLPRISVCKISPYFKNSTLMEQLQNTVYCSQYSKHIPIFINETLKHKSWK
jgi:hypothetical protein